MLMAYLTFLTGIAISAIAIYYSVMGLTAIFAAAVIPIVVMGTVLEVAKLVTTVWLKQNWNRAPRLIKAYLSIAVLVLMLITSMGIFGFLSKAHSDQSLVSGDVQSKLAIYDEKINTAKENIEAARRQLKQMDEAVDQVMARSTSEAGASRANSIRKSQQRDRVALAKEIETNQKLVASLNDEAAPIRAEIRKVEAEVGPIKYIAAFVYGDNPDANILEKAVTWVIITIIFVFDPLAVLLLLASQYSFAWVRQEKELEQEPVYTYETFEKPTEEELAEIGPEPETAEGDSLATESEANIVKDTTVTHQFVDMGEHPKDSYDYEHVVETSEPEPLPEPDYDPLPVPAYEPDDGPLTQDQIDQINAQLENDSDVEKEARRRWKAENPDGSIHLEMRKKDLGLIDVLPWEETDALERPGDYLTDLDDSKKKSYIVKEQNRQVRKTKE